MNNMDNYKYRKYKSKCIALLGGKNQNVLNPDTKFDPNQYTFDDVLCGEITYKQWTDFYAKKEALMKKSLVGIQNTNSYVDRSKLTDEKIAYFIHWNGGRHYRVIINSDAIIVAELDADTEPAENPDKELVDAIIPYEKCDCVTGYHYDTFMKLTTFDGYYYGFDTSAERMHGNSLLVKLPDNLYIVISHSIYLFKMTEPVVDYVSYVGNNDVPYPIIVSDKHIYLIESNKINMYDRSHITTPITLDKIDKLVPELYNIKNPQKMPGVNLIHVSNRNL